jgi:hypothetical protein
MRITILRSLSFLALFFLACLLSLQVIAAGSDPQFTPLTKGQKVVVAESRYSPKGTVVSTELQRFLDRLGPFLQENPGLVIEVGGHTDSTGSPAMNKIISLKRAEEVIAYLVEKHKIPPERLIARAYGSERPLGDNGTENGRALNRRVEISPQSLLEPPARLTYLRRDVLSKRSYQEEFSKAVVNQGLFNHDRVLTRKESMANVLFEEQSELRLDPESLLIMQARTSDTSSPGTTENVQLLTGGLRTRLNRLKGSFSVGTPSCRIDAESVEIVVGLDAKKRAGVSVFDGKSKVKASGQEVQVPEGFGTTVDEGKPPDPPEPLPPAPTLKSPLQATVMVEKGTNLASVTLSWETPLEENMVDISPDENFSQLVQQQRIRGRDYKATLEPGTWYWRVSALSVKGLVGFPAHSSVTVIPFKASVELPLTVNGIGPEPLWTCDNPFQLTGRSELGARIESAGQSTPVDERGTFSLSIPLEPGLNKNQVTGSHPDFTSRTVSYSLRYQDFWEPGPVISFRVLTMPATNFDGAIGFQVGRSFDLGPHGQGEYAIGLAGMSWEEFPGQYTRNALSFPVTGEVLLMMNKSVRTVYLALGLTVYPTLLRERWPEGEETSGIQGGLVSHFYVSPEIGLGIALPDWGIPMEFQVSYSGILKDEPTMSESTGGINLSLKAIL